MSDGKKDDDKSRFSIKIGDGSWVWVLFWLIVVYMMIYGDPLFWLRQ